MPTTTVPPLPPGESKLDTIRRHVLWTTRTRPGCSWVTPWRHSGCSVSSNHCRSTWIQSTLFVYLPCGVGGAPGGITFGLHHLFQDHVHCFCAEPVSSPCMLARLASLEWRSVSVREIGLDNVTEADGLAVARASEFAASMIEPLVSGVFTVGDDDLLADLYLLEQTEGMRIEPSAAAGLRGPRWLLHSETGDEYIRNHGLAPHMTSATHVLWTTGGALLPEDEYRGFHERGRVACSARQPLRS